MRRGCAVCLSLAVVLTFPAAVGLAQGYSTDPADNWPQWRGPEGTGAAPNARPPLRWSESENVRWKIELPGGGHATPIVWGERVFVQTAIDTGRAGEAPEAPARAEQPRGRRGRFGRGRGSRPTTVHRFVLLAIDRRDGRILWDKTLREEVPHEGKHPTNSMASGSAVTDGRRIWAYFGSQGLYCLDMEGNVVWQKDLGLMRIKLGFGEGSSPALHGQTLVVTRDHEGDSEIIALDKHTGEVLWRTQRDEGTTWSTPVIVPVGDGAQVITAATDYCRAYDLATGELVWRCQGLTDNVIPTPVYSGSNGLVYLISGFRGAILRAVRVAEASGDITGADAIAWTHDSRTPYVPSPLLYGDSIYFLSGNDGILSCLDAATGRPRFESHRLEAARNIYASPVGAAGRVYIVSQDGATEVLEHGPEPRVLAVNELDDGFDASPAIAGNELFLRGRRYLYCIAGD